MIKILILAKKNPTTCYLVNSLFNESDLFLIEECDSQLINIYKKVKRYIVKEGYIRGLIRAGNFLFELPYLFRENKRLEKFLTAKTRANGFRKDISSQQVGAINSGTVVSRAKMFQPKVILVLGTSIIPRQTITDLKEISPYVVNLHMGITPEYRGVKSEFWCVLNNCPDMVGSTIHYLDAGVDTGAVLMQEKISLQNITDQQKKDYRWLRYKNLQLAIDMLKRFIKTVDKGEELKLLDKTSHKSRLYTTPQKVDFKKYYKRINYE